MIYSYAQSFDLTEKYVCTTLMRQQTKSRIGKNLSNCNGADRAVEEFRSLLAIPLTLFIDLKGGQKLHKTVVLSRPQIN